MNILELPPLCLAHILVAADIHTLCALEQTSKSFLLASSNYLVWKEICQREQLQSFLDNAPMESFTSTTSAEHSEAFVTSYLQQFWPEGERRKSLLESFEEQGFKQLSPDCESVKSSAYVRCGAPSVSAARNAFYKTIVCCALLIPSVDGFYTGLYGSHGIELVYVEQKGCYVNATKITGDLNVPAGVVSWEFMFDVGGVNLGRIQLAMNQIFRNRHFGGLKMQYNPRSSPVRLTLEWRFEDDWSFRRMSLEDAGAFYASVLSSHGADAVNASTFVLAPDALPPSIAHDFRTVQPSLFSTSAR